MPRGLKKASATSYGQPRGNPRGDQAVATSAAAEIARIRQKMRRSVDKRFAVLEAIADGEPVHKVKLGEGADTVEATVSASPADRIKALDTLLRYGVGTAPASVDVTSGGEPISPQTWVFGAKPVDF